MRTSTVKPPAPQWLLVNAEGKAIGKVAARVATLLRGKHKVGFSPHQIWGDHVIVVNAAKVSIQPRKLLGKVYYRHTGYTGHLKRWTLKEVMSKHPQKALELAVGGMLPRNRLRSPMLERLHVCPLDEHPYTAQSPVCVEV